MSKCSNDCSHCRATGNVPAKFLPKKPVTNKPTPTPKPTPVKPESAWDENKYGK